MVILQLFKKLSHGGENSENLLKASDSSKLLSINNWPGNNRSGPLDPSLECGFDPPQGQRSPWLPSNLSLIWFLMLVPHASHFHQSCHPECQLVLPFTSPLTRTSTLFQPCHLGLLGPVVNKTPTPQSLKLVPRFYVEVLIHSTSECDLISK